MRTLEIKHCKYSNVILILKLHFKAFDLSAAVLVKKKCTLCDLSTLMGFSVNLELCFKIWPTGRCAACVSAKNI